MGAELGNDEPNEMQLTLQYSSNPSVFVTTPKMDWSFLNLTAANYVVITHKFWILDNQQQAFALVLRKG